MRRCFLLLLPFALLCPELVSAQDWVVEGISEDTKPTHAVYITNRWRDNLFIGGTAGISNRFTTGSKSDITSTYANPDLNLFILKWFTPIIGLRLGYEGINGREGLDRFNPYQIGHCPLPYKLDSTGEFVTAAEEPGVLHYGLMHLHLDFLWNITNTFGGFRRDRFFEISAYFSGGYLRLWDNKTDGNKGIGSSNNDNEFALGVGAYATFKLTQRLDAVADLHLTNHASRYRSENGVRTNIAAISVGVAYNLHKTYWNDGKEVAMTVQQARDAEVEARAMLAEAQESNAELEKTVEVLQEEVRAGKVDQEELKNLKDEVESMPYQLFKQRAEEAELVVYFYINQTTLNFSEMHHLDNYVMNTLAIEPNHVFKVTGSADRSTGTEDKNKELSRARAEYVKNLLIKKYGVNPKNIITSSVVTDKNIEAALDRCALLER